MNVFDGAKKLAKAQQATAIPYRLKGKTLQFCLISASSGQWIFPKGIIDGHQDYLETASTEAFEEAGLHGEIMPRPVGFYEIKKQGQTLVVVAVLMKVTKADKVWEESDWRKRRWVSVEEAHRLLDKAGLKELLDSAVEIVSRTP